MRNSYQLIITAFTSLWLLSITLYLSNNKKYETRVVRVVERISRFSDEALHQENKRLAPVGKSAAISVDPKIRHKSTIAIFRDQTSWKVDTEICSSKEKFQGATLKSAAGNTLLYVNVFGDVISRRVASKQGFFEKDLEGPLFQCLNEDKDLVFLDIGANIGVFSMAAAKKGHKVIAIEVLPGNAARLCRSAKDGGFTGNVTLIHNGVSNHRAWNDIAYKKGREGNVYIRETRTPTRNSTYSILLDDLLEVLDMKRVVMKIDVERHEAKVLEGAKKFFEKVDVTCIMMEWERHPRSPDAFQMMVFMAKHGMLGYDPQNLGRSLDASRYTQWPRNVLWRKVRDYGPFTP
ncbi:uncharacterized protein LOC121368310 [Gigantopelta aegis]|uniref:uncharacterized protein LOC121368310 n=1 Tax=Gigantopelta aegis TaxID=1735272 RepID=UPI001B88CD63|nr:uncharacterized protein LOC121368310 [Gigantopelta aegis]